MSPPSWLVRFLCFGTIFLAFSNVPSGSASSTEVLGDNANGLPVSAETATESNEEGDNGTPTLQTRAWGDQNGSGNWGSFNNVRSGPRTRPRTPRSPRRNNVVINNNNWSSGGNNFSMDSDSGFTINNGGMSFGTGGMNFNGGISSFTTNGKYVNIESDKAKVTMISPQPIRFTLRGNEAFVNQESVCSDVKSLKPEREYRIMTNGSMWNTNLPVGRAMTPEESAKFKDLLEKVEVARRRRDEVRNAADNLRDKKRSAADRAREADRAVAERIRGDADRAREAACAAADRERDSAYAAADRMDRQRRGDYRAAANETRNRKRDEANRARDVARAKAEKIREAASRKREIATDAADRERETARNAAQKEWDTTFDRLVKEF